MELVLKLRHFTNILQTALVKFNFLVRHNSACAIALGCIIQTLGHARKDLLYFFVLVVELVSGGDVGLEE